MKWVPVPMFLALFALGQECPPCPPLDGDAVRRVKDDLEEAFVLSLSLPDCAGAANLESCRAVERLLTKAFETLQALVESNRAAGCFSCEPGPELPPLAAALESLARLLEERGHADFGPALRAMEAPLAAMRVPRCCGAEASAPADGPAEREDDVRAVLTAKCGAGFVENRRGLRQVLRAPGDRQGCFQSRACRKGDSYQGLATQSGFWTYDGEYWYIWRERQTSTGEWVACDP